MKNERHRRLCQATVLVVVAATAWATRNARIEAHGPYPEILETVQKLEPAYRAEFDRGEVGIVRPRFARRYLVQAYRVWSGQPALKNVARRPWEISADGSAWQPNAQQQWVDLSNQTMGVFTPPSQIAYAHVYRYLGPDQTQAILNCPGSAFANAVKTLKARIVRYGASSAEAREWTQAQAAVFQNCEGNTLILPPPRPAGADALRRADGDYQTAAAYFYGTRYEEAARRFRAIGLDATSPWRRYGRFLAARSTIRLATVNDNPRMNELLQEAEADLQGVVADPSAAEVRGYAQDLLNYLAARLRPMDRVHALSKLVSTSAIVSDQDLLDYTRLMDKFIGNTTEYSEFEVKEAGELARDDDLNDWILSSQESEAIGLPRAIARWKETGSQAWLVSVMWNIPPEHVEAEAVLAAAAAVDRRSPAYPTVAYLRIKLLLAGGRTADARAVLVNIPRRVAPGYSLETLNLFKSQRLAIARSFQEFLDSAPRTLVGNWTTYVRDPDTFHVVVKHGAYDRPTLETDAAAIFTSHLPLSRLVDASTSVSFPPRLRVRVAMAAFSRAVVLQRDDAARRVAPVLEASSPALQTEVERYLRATTPADRRRAMVMLFLRTPGMHAYVQGLDDNITYSLNEPWRKLSRGLLTNWWCSKHLASGTELWPAFVTPAEKEATERELGELRAVGSFRDYLAVKTLEWAKAEPNDPELAEALALTVEGGHWSCGTADSADLSQRAFQTLHRLFRNSDWAKRTKYWYESQ